jgi:hypothetical protein
MIQFFLPYFASVQFAFPVIFFEFICIFACNLLGFRLLWFLFCYAILLKNSICLESVFFLVCNFLGFSLCLLEFAWVKLALARICLG